MRIKKSITSSMIVRKIMIHLFPRPYKLILHDWIDIIFTRAELNLKLANIICDIPMAHLSLPDQDAVARSTSNTVPDHYTVTIQLFSQLVENKIDYTSSDFEAGGYKWKLVLHPNGNKNKGITDHISLYLVIADGSSLPPGWEIQAKFRLSLLDQNKDVYLTLQHTAEKGRRFHRTKQEWGFDKFIPHTEFNDSANGYLVNDSCAFGAEVYVCLEKHRGKGESLTMIKDAISHENSWRIDNFSSLAEECVDSKPFNAGGYKWKMQLYPKGKGTGSGSYMSLYLTLAEPANLPPASKIYAEFRLQIPDQAKGTNFFGKANYWFSATNPTCGWPKFISHRYLHLSTNNYVVKNICLLEAEVTVHGVANAL